MDGAGLINFLKISTSTQNSDIPDSTYTLALSESHAKIVEKIKTKIDSKIFYSEFTADFEINKKEYDQLPITTASAIFVRYTEFEPDWVTQTPYIKARIKDMTELSQPLSYYEANQSKISPIFMIADNSIFLYPVADNDVTDWIQIRGGLKVPRITALSAESDIFEWKLSEYHEVISRWAEELIYRINKDISWARESKTNFKEDLDTMITEISSRYDQPVDYIEPDFSNLAYNIWWENPFNNNVN